MKRSLRRRHPGRPRRPLFEYNDLHVNTMARHRTESLRTTEETVLYLDLDNVTKDRVLDVLILTAFRLGYSTGFDDAREQSCVDPTTRYTNARPRPGVDE